MNNIQAENLLSNLDDNMPIKGGGRNNNKYKK